MTETPHEALVEAATRVHHEWSNGDGSWDRASDHWRERARERMSAALKVVADALPEERIAYRQDSVRDMARIRGFNSALREVRALLVGADNGSVIEGSGK